MSDTLDLAEYTEVISGEMYSEYQAEWVTEKEKCDDIVSKLSSTNDDSDIFYQIQSINRVERIAAKVKAVLLVAYAKWYTVQNPQGSFLDYYTQRTSADRLTVQKLVAVGALLEDVSVPDSVKEQPYKNLISVARAQQSGYEFTESDWTEISRSSRESEVNSVVSKVKKKPTRKGSLEITVFPDGAIMGKMDGERANLGWLNYADRNNEDLTPGQRKIVQMGTSRLAKDAGAFEVGG